MLQKRLKEKVGRKDIKRVRVRVIRMKSYSQFLEESKKKKEKRKPTVEVMPTIKDGEKGMTTKPDNS